MENRIRRSTANHTAQAEFTDEARDVYQQLAARAGRKLLTALQALPAYKPRTNAPLASLRITVEVVDGPELGVVVLDTVNVHDLAELTARRAEGLNTKHTAPAAPSARPALRLLGGGR